MSIPSPPPGPCTHAGLLCKDGLQLSLPRRSLGVEFWHKGAPDHFFVLLPRHVDAPCSARQIFTTLHDDQVRRGGVSLCPYLSFLNIC